jgi:hypothetical protein
LERVSYGGMAGDPRVSVFLVLLVDLWLALYIVFVVSKMVVWKPNCFKLIYLCMSYWEDCLP